MKQLFRSPGRVGAVLVLPLIALCAAVRGLSPAMFLYLVLAAGGVAAVGTYYYFRFVWFRAAAELRLQDVREKANLLEAEIKRQWGVLEAARKKLIDYSQLKVLAERLNQCFSLEETSRLLSGEVSRLFGQEEMTVILYLFHSKTGELGISASKKGQIEVNLKAKKGDAYDQWVVKNMTPLLIEDASQDFRFDRDKIQIEDARPIGSLMSVPLLIGDRAIGILRLDSPVSNYFQTESIRFLSTIGDLGAVAIENAQLYERVEDLAIHDSLTGLFLRRHFLDRMAQEMSRELRKNQEISFLMLDLDHFKQYNDQFGHMAGDIVLKALAMMLRDTFSLPGDCVCRYGGEEFAVFLPECSQAKAVELAEGFREKIEAQRFLIRRSSTRITVSIGVATFPQDATVREELIERADRALYLAKQEGRNRVRAAGPGGRAQGAER